MILFDAYGRRRKAGGELHKDRFEKETQLEAAQSEQFKIVFDKLPRPVDHDKGGLFNIALQLKNVENKYTITITSWLDTENNNNTHHDNETINTFINNLASIALKQKWFPNEKNTTHETRSTKENLEENDIQHTVSQVEVPQDSKLSQMEIDETLSGVLEEMLALLSELDYKFCGRKNLDTEDHKNGVVRNSVCVIRE